MNRNKLLQVILFILLVPIGFSYCTPCYLRDSCKNWFLGLLVFCLWPAAIFTYGVVQTVFICLISFHILINIFFFYLFVDESTAGDRSTEVTDTERSIDVLSGKTEAKPKGYILQV